MMKVRLLKDWSYHKNGEVAEVFDPTAQNWIANGIAEPATETRSVEVEEAVACDAGTVERAVVSRRHRKP